MPTEEVQGLELLRGEQGTVGQGLPDWREGQKSEPLVNSGKERQENTAVLLTSERLPFCSLVCRRLPREADGSIQRKSEQYLNPRQLWL